MIRLRAIVDSILDAAPERFYLVGLSMGGYIALEMAEHAPERMEKLVLMDTSARDERPEQTASRRVLMTVAREQGMDPVIDRLLPLFIKESRLSDKALTAIVAQMARDTGVDAFIRQGNGDHRPKGRPSGPGGHHMSDAGSLRRRRQTDSAGIIGRNRRRHCQRPARVHRRQRPYDDTRKAGSGTPRLLTEFLRLQ